MQQADVNDGGGPPSIPVPRQSRPGTPSRAKAPTLLNRAKASHCVEKSEGFHNAGSEDIHYIQAVMNTQDWSVSV